MAPRENFVSRIRATLGHRDYGLYALGNMLSLIGNWTQRTTIGWLMWDVTESTLLVGLVVFLELFPAVVIAPFAGAIADRWSRARIIRATHCVAAVLAFGFAVLVLNGEALAEATLVYAFLNGMLTGLDQPSRMSIVKTMVPASRLPTALAINSIIFNMARFIGPPLAALFIVMGGAWLGILIYALGLVPLIVILGGYARRDRSAEAVASRRQQSSIMAAMGEGLRYVAFTPVVLALVLLQAGIGISVRPVLELIPGIVGVNFGGDPDSLAILAASVGVGAILAGLVMSALAEARSLRRALWGGAFTAPFWTMAVVALGTVEAAAVGAALLGASLVISGVATQSLVQLMVPSEFLGRTLSIYGIVFRGCPALGAFLLGLLAEVQGFLLPIAILSAILWAALVAIAFVWGRRIAHGLNGTSLSDGDQA